MTNYLRNTLRKNRIRLDCYGIGSLFSGAGGLDLGFAMTGQFAPVFAVEILHWPAVTYSVNFRLQLYNTDQYFSGPGVYEGSVATLDFKTMEKHWIEILTAGPPCQDFSVVRGPEWDRKGIEVKRGRLYLEFIRALGALQPKMFVFENVPGLMSANKGAAFRAVIDDLVQAGWHIVFADVVDSADFGVPQRRKRLIIIGINKNLSNFTSPSTAVKIFRERLKNNKSLLKKYPLTPLEVFEGKPLPALAEKYKDIMGEYKNLCRFGNIVDDYLKINNIDSGTVNEIEKAFEEHEKILEEMGWYNKPIYECEFSDGTHKILSESERVLTRMRRIPPNGNHENVRGTKWEVEGRGISLVYRRLHPLKPAYTIVAYGGGGTWGYHYERGRSKLTHRERARLQTFPDTFLFSGGSQAIRAQIGEAVPPLLAKRIAEVCLEVLRE
mgnify:CR=1 FL=1